VIERVQPARTAKPWGYELLIARTGTYVGKVLHVTAGHTLSLQYHERKEETIHLFSGEALMVYRDDAGRPGTATMTAGDTFHVPPRSVHRLEAITDCDFFEVSTTELDDVVRLEDRYGRAAAPDPSPTSARRC
jgi:oxalate decarboxylase/phosphoglucose isomerase-like protein (cupin superfamily)